MPYVVVSIINHEDEAGNIHNFLLDANLIDLIGSAIVC
jgi:hypothetical protein